MASVRLPVPLLVLLVASATATVAAFAIQFLPEQTGSKVTRNVPLRALFPTSAFGWQGRDLPLAQTESAVDQAEKILRFDEFIFRSYQKQGLEFSVYVAFWSPGRIAAREVAFHIPDKCWVAAGWKRQSATYDHPVAIGGHTLAPAQLRQFSAAGSVQNVLYWHIFNGNAIIYNRDGSPSDLSMLTDLARHGLNLKGEQYFIRVSSSTSFEELFKDEGFVQVMELIAELGPGMSRSLRQF
ncbi:MAG: exosortase-associated EpsI family protein [Opitutaceae bacterium]|nr:exosortase-associated EpsI family protein [Opitutaceae bacterium]